MWFYAVPTKCVDDRAPQFSTALRERLMLTKLLLQTREALDHEAILRQSTAYHRRLLDYMYYLQVPSRPCFFRWTLSKLFYFKQGVQCEMYCGFADIRMEFLMTTYNCVCAALNSAKAVSDDPQKSMWYLMYAAAYADVGCRIAKVVESENHKLYTDLPCAEITSALFFILRNYALGMACIPHTVVRKLTGSALINCLYTGSRFIANARMRFYSYFMTNQLVLYKLLATEARIISRVALALSKQEAHRAWQAFNQECATQSIKCWRPHYDLVGLCSTMHLACWCLHVAVRESTVAAATMDEQADLEIIQADRTATHKKLHLTELQYRKTSVTGPEIKRIIEAIAYVRANVVFIDTISSQVQSMTTTMLAA